MEGDVKECPFCAEAIKAKAYKCIHCGEWLEGHTRRSVYGDQTTTVYQEEQTVHGPQVIAGEDANIGQIGDNIDTGGGDYINVEGDVTLGKALRDEQHQIALNWDGKTRLRGFDLSGRDLQSLNLDKADLSGANLRKADLRFTKLRGAILRKADLREATLRRTELIGTDLSEAKLNGANLSGAILPAAHLGEANMNGADLRWADLRGAILVRANLSEAKLNGADLSEAKLSGASLSGAMYTNDTTWPNRFDPIEAGAELVDY